eukprot:6207867-Pleurochrysis_carterae.AAC.1
MAVQCRNASFRTRPCTTQGSSVPPVLPLALTDAPVVLQVVEVGLISKADLGVAVSSFADNGKCMQCANTDRCAHFGAYPLLAASSALTTLGDGGCCRNRSVAQPPPTDVVAALADCAPYDAESPNARRRA